MTAVAPVRRPPLDVPGPADAVMRRLLRIGRLGVPGATTQATRAFSTSVVFSGLRCLLTYLVIPALGPTTRFTGTVGRPLVAVLGILAIVFSVRSMRRFWMANHPRRWQYSVFAGIVIVYVVTGLIVDFVHLAT